MRLLCARFVCLLVGHRLDENAVNNYGAVLRHCDRCNADVTEAR
jgi:hypothetical protein